MEKQTAAWTSNLKFVKERPQIATASAPNTLKQALLGTLQGGALQIKASELPIKLKSLRTAVIQVARSVGKPTETHVVLNKEAGTITMWLAPRARRTGRKLAKTA